MQGLVLIKFSKPDPWYDYADGEPGYLCIARRISIDNRMGDYLPHLGKLQEQIIIILVW